MSHALISRNPDLQRLRDEGYNIRIHAGHCVMSDIPYVTTEKVPRIGALVSPLQLNGDTTEVPTQHVIYFAGEYPCDQYGVPLSRIQHQSNTQALAKDLIINHSFSSKPADGYRDYHHKMTAYANILWGPAHAINPASTPKTFPVILPDDDASVFSYLDTASTRAGIMAVSSKLAIPSIAIVGLGGTGSYVLDLVAKTPVGAIHLFDGDAFLQHNAFRSPGAPTIEILKERRNKAEHCAQQYAPMRRYIVPHPYHIDATNVDELRVMAFAFLCLDKNQPKQVIIEALEAFGIPFVDVGMGVNLINGALQGMARITTSTPEKRDHARTRIPLTDAPGLDEYHQNIQIADLNALNAALAVIKWKKHVGFYHDMDHEHHCTYTVDGNQLLNEDHA